jgi:hypothetical protein
MSIRSISEYGLDYLKTAYHIDRVACDIIPTENAVPSWEILVIVKKNGQNWYESWLDTDNHDLASLKQLLKSGIITQCLSTPTSRGQQIKDKQLSLFH